MTTAMHCGACGTPNDTGLAACVGCGSTNWTDERDMTPLTNEERAIVDREVQAGNQRLAEMFGAISATEPAPALPARPDFDATAAIPVSDAAQMDNAYDAGKAAAATLRQQLANEQAAHERTRQELAAAVERAAFNRDQWTATSATLAGMYAKVGAAEARAGRWKRAAKVHFRHHRHQREIATNWKDSLYLAQVECRKLKAEIERATALTLVDSSAALTEALAILAEVDAAGNLWPAQQERLAALKATTTNPQAGEEGGDGDA